MSQSYPARIRKQKGGWALYWPWPAWRLCRGCQKCADDPGGPCSMRVRRHPAVTKHVTAEDAQAFALLRGMGPVLVEE